MPRPLTLVENTCEYCHNIFLRTLGTHNKRKKKYKRTFCSQKCLNNSQGPRTMFNCSECNSPVYRNTTDIKKSKSGKFFCNRTCRSKFFYKPIPSGSQRSKLEFYIESMILKHFSNLNFITNDRDTIGLELDLYFPDIKIAIEINGPTHYEPIFGSKKLLEIQSRDNIKRIACDKLSIQLIIIDNLKKFKPKFINSVWLEVKAILNEF